MKQRSFQMIKTNGVTLRTVVEGSGPLLILLHGFPQCWYLWRHQIDPLVAAGFQVAVPDWGAPVAWHTALLHPKRVHAVVGMSVPYARGQAGAMTRQENFGDNF